MTIATVKGNTERKKTQGQGISKELPPERNRIRVKLFTVGRARCAQCAHRFVWPDGAPTVPESPLVRPSVACPSCHSVVSLEAEPHDECWWRYASKPPPAKPAKAQSPSLVPRSHARPNGDTPPRQLRGRDL